MTRACLTCEFWEYADVDTSKAPWGLCRVKPPESSSSCVISKRNLWSGQWPGSKANDWCGSYVQKDSTATGVVVGHPQIQE